ncbi:MAG: holo-ACP synthase [Pelagibacteraceae bacterium]|nr:holo-ACP synthase [Pelagibacteraceae bacterium]|tara:strand:- start:5712 stop:6104 length:393 start_codon:yes stop_codon:yes gene_type:complete
MIIGIGSDIVDIRRIDKTISKFGNKFIKRCFTDTEITKSESVNKRINSYAKRFAAKEAFSKALGTGFSNGIYWKDIGVINDKYGKPKIKLTGKSLKKFKKLIPKNKKHSINLTLSDENHIAHALVIISSH